MGSSTAPSARGDDDFVISTFLQQRRSKPVTLIFSSTMSVHVATSPFYDRGMYALWFEFLHIVAGAGSCVFDTLYIPPNVYALPSRCGTARVARHRHQDAKIVDGSYKCSGYGVVILVIRLCVPINYSAVRACYFLAIGPLPVSVSTRSNSSRVCGHKAADADRRWDARDWGRDDCGFICNGFYLRFSVLTSE